MAKKSNNNQGNKYQPNFFGMISTVLVASLNKGQFMLGIAGMIILVAIIKMDSEHVYSFMISFLDLFKEFKYFGWLLSVVFLGGWFHSGKKLRQVQTKEITRMAGQKSQMQSKLLLKDLNSTQNKE